ncbi:MAG: DUF1573 domain-containing protein [Flavobacteriaceae bacterium]|jgi:hypothetical protein|nr:hypothetical protein [Flavobacteriaceae bacterium]|tara:strand:- start:7619 stop:8107 length:489 start_codon:yes stop_codon:yes gene_type:complete
MKSFALALVALLALGCSQSASNKVKQENVAEAAAKQKAIVDLPVMTFDRTEHNFGTINEGDIVETSFVFTNTGNSDLMISDARGSCGCTVPEYPKNTPIAPGETRDIKVKFDSANKPGNQTKTVTLTNNTERGRDIIRIRTMVTADPVKEQQRQEARNQIKQ